MATAPGSRNAIVGAHVGEFAAAAVARAVTVLARGGCEGGTCGLVAQAECNTAGCTGPYTENNNNICEPCGGLGQECCEAASHDILNR